MTTIIEEEVTCAVCGMKQTVQEMGSTSSFGAMDLDARPPPLRRSTMHLWVHECGECGYVAPELAAAADGAGRIVASAEYRAELKSADRVQMANRMVCRSLLDAATGDLTTAGWRRLHAAWACDDANAMDEAQGQRLAALELFERARASGQRAMKSVEGGDELLLADIARRAGDLSGRWDCVSQGSKLPTCLSLCAGFSSSNEPWYWHGTRHVTTWARSRPPPRAVRGECIRRREVAVTRELVTPLSDRGVAKDASIAWSVAMLAIQRRRIAVTIALLALVAVGGSSHGRTGRSDRLGMFKPPRLWVGDGDVLLWVDTGSDRQYALDALALRYVGDYTDTIHSRRGHPSRVLVRDSS